MNKALALAPLLLPVPAMAAPTQSVTWDFFETGCASTSSVPCSQTAGTPVLVSLVLPSATSSGNASWDGIPADPAQLSGDTFELFSFAGPPIGAPAFGTDEHGCGIAAGPCGYNLMWTEDSDQLSAFSFNYRSPSTQINLGLAGGTVSTDSTFGRCDASTCQITGFTADPPGAPLAPAIVADVPEPASLGLLSFGLFAAWRRHRHGPGAKPLMEIAQKVSPGSPV